LRKHLSVLALWYRCSFKWEALCMVVMSVAELVLFARALGKADPAVSVALEELLAGSLIPQVCMLGFTYVVCGLYSMSGANTLARLSIREETAALWQTVYNACCLLLFWAVQAVLILIMCLWYARWMDSAYVSGQTAVLAAYRIPFFHRFLPVADWLIWLSNLLLVTELAFSPACAGLRLRRGSRSSLCFLGMGLMMLTEGLGAAELMELEHLLLFAAILCLCVDGVYFVERWRGKPDEE